jgi:short-subunit dehydrogenase
MKYRTALVTGASSGIGAATARLLAEEGIFVALAARREERLRALVEDIEAGGGHAAAFPVDLSEADAPERLFRQVCEKLGNVDVLVNNAAFGYYGYFAEMDLETLRNMTMVNVNAPAALTILALREMIPRGFGHIIQIGSISPDVPSQGSAWYAATKAAMDVGNIALYRELRGTGVRLSVVRPGPVQTEFFDAANRQKNAIPHLGAKMGGVPPERVARKVVWLLRHPRKRVHVPASAAWFRLLEWTTGWLQDWIGPVDLRRYHSLK